MDQVEIDPQLTKGPVVTGGLEELSPNALPEKSQSGKGLGQHAELHLGNKARHITLLDKQFFFFA